ncbi:MAG TPA: hypothetical protein VHK44_08230 [Xanthobacteraceae bacterium]|jgi:hypothetical protein|nr:hypothetical protein [Xanthobacteraceae bacterium]
MKKISVFTVVSAIALALAAAPAEAASKKKSKGSKAKVTVSKQAPVTGYWSAGFNNCASWAAGAWYPIAAVGAVSCGVVYAVPVMVEGFVAPQAKQKDA